MLQMLYSLDQNTHIGFRPDPPTRPWLLSLMRKRHPCQLSPCTPNGGFCYHFGEGAATPLENYIDLNPCPPAHIYTEPGVPSTGHRGTSYKDLVDCFDQLLSTVRNDPAYICRVVERVI